MAREAVKWFSEIMETKLKENDYKGGWSRISQAYLISKLKAEVKALERAMDTVDNQENVIMKSANVANFAMMIADIAGELHGK